MRQLLTQPKYFEESWEIQRGRVTFSLKMPSSRRTRNNSSETRSTYGPLGHSSTFAILFRLSFPYRRLVYEYPNGAKIDLQKNFLVTFKKVL